MHCALALAPWKEQSLDHPFAAYANTRNYHGMFVYSSLLHT